MVTSPPLQEVAPFLFDLRAYDFVLPETLIAQQPCEPRDQARLMIVQRSTGKISHGVFRDLLEWLKNGDLLVLNDTRVIPARLLGTRNSGGVAEILLLRPLGEDRWLALAKPGRRLHEGSEVHFGPGFWCRVEATLDDGSKIVQFFHGGDFQACLKDYGRVPLPPYVHRDPEEADATDYQTVYARHDGAVAAPTAGLHFTESMMESLSDKGVVQGYITLHVGNGTFVPVQAQDIRCHHMHSERISISPESAQCINSLAKDRRQICVGTTSCRALESAADESGKVCSGDFETDLFIYPGYRFKAVKNLLTNFHLPRTSLLMMVSAFAGYDLLREAYDVAIKEQYRFYSYGDAMLIL